MVEGGGGWKETGLKFELEPKILFHTGRQRLREGETERERMAGEDRETWWREGGREGGGEGDRGTE